MALIADRYVELSFKLPDEPLTQFRATVVIDSPNPIDAANEAVADLMRAHPQATHVEEFMQRRLTDDQRDDILAAIDAGTWEGWSFGR